MQKLEVAKFAIGFISGSSAAFCVRGVVSAAVQPETPEEKFRLVVGSFAIGSMVHYHTRQYVDQSIDEIVGHWNDFQAKKNTPE